MVGSLPACCPRSGQTEQVGKVGTVRNQSPKLDEVTRLVHGWKPMFHGALDNQFALRRREKGAPSDYSGLHLLVRLANRRIDGPGLKIGHFKNLSSTPSVCAAFASGAKNGIPAPRRLITPIRTRPGKISVHPSLAARPVATMITKECFGCEKVTSHEHLHDCAPGIPETHMVGSERFVCVLCKHVTFAGSDGASRFPFTFDKVAAGR